MVAWKDRLQTGWIVLALLCFLFEDHEPLNFSAAYLRSNFRSFVSFLVPKRTRFTENPSSQWNKRSESRRFCADLPVASSPASGGCLHWSSRVWERRRGKYRSQNVTRWVTAPLQLLFPSLEGKLNEVKPNWTSSSDLSHCSMNWWWIHRNPALIRFTSKVN